MKETEKHRTIFPDLSYNPADEEEVKSNFSYNSKLSEAFCK
jgi:hypothetical protein